MTTAPGVTDVHIHIQPWDQLKPEVAEVMRRGKEEHWERLLAIMDDPAALIEIMDAAGVWRAGLVNYASPDLMGFTHATNDFAVRYASHAPERLLPYGGLHPRHVRDPEGEVDALVDAGIRVLKVHPCHMEVAANAHLHGDETLGRIYRRCEERGLPVMVHTGTSTFPGARSRLGHPMDLDDVCVDFPDLQVIMAHGGRPLWMREAFFLIRRHPNLWFDVSGIPPRRLPEWYPRLPEVAGKVVWGTDWPGPGVRDMGANLEQFLDLEWPDDMKTAVTRDNPLRLLPSGKSG